MANLDETFQAISRRIFLPDEVKDSADLDIPLPIGFGQTNSQPSTVRMLLEWLDPEQGDKILDVGSGSGWTTGLIAYMIGREGAVYAVEKIAELVLFGRDNCRNAGLDNVRFFEAGPTYGLPQYAPYDRILVSAAASDMPTELLDQLKIGGRLVIPIRNSIHVIDKTGSDTYDAAEHPGFIFVPLV